MRRGLVAAFTVACVSIAPSARAEKVQDDTTGFDLDLDVSPDTPCVVVPRRSEAGACRTTDVQALADQLESSGDPILFAIHVDRGDWTYLLVVSRRPGAGEYDDRETRSIGAHAGDGLQSPSVEVHQPSPPVTVTRSNNDVQVVAAPVSLSTTTATGIIHTRVVSYFIAGAGRYVLTTRTDDAHAADVEKIAERALSTVKLDPPSKSSNATGLEASVSYFIKAVFGLALVVVAIVIIRRLARAR